MEASVPQQADTATRRTTATTALAALGIVYGDLGTSPLYTYQTIVGTVGGHPSAADAVGLLSLVVWALIVTVSLKYCVFVMRADNGGEGGILALMSLVTEGRGAKAGGTLLLTAMGLFGAALIYGDGAITPAISVLSALEGINVATDAFKPYVLPAALLILLGLFAVQVRGTAAIGKIFGPVMALWFVVIAALGVLGVLRHPEVIWALDPRQAAGFAIRHGMHTFFVLGGVFLAITGGEALYADMGHIGRNPIRSAWYGLVLPSLLLSYAGQTALLIGDPNLDGNPFFKLAPAWAVVPLVALATLATIIASQAIITGAFSLTRQAMQLGWFPGLHIRQTSDEEYGQIYVPVVNWTMMAATLALAYGFGSSDKLAGAYGTAVSTTMLLTTGLLYTAMRKVWGWPVPVAAVLSLLFLGIDLAFFAANLLKLLEGGWIPLLFGAILFVAMTIWRRGVTAVQATIQAANETPATFLADLNSGAIPRVEGTGVFLSRSDAPIPPLLLRQVSQIGALHQTLISLTVHFAPVPRISNAERVVVTQVADGFWHIAARFGFVEIPNLAQALACARDQNCPLDLDHAIYFASRDEVVQSPHRPRLPAWRRMIFGVMFRNAVHAPDRFTLPADRFVELGRQVGI